MADQTWGPLSRLRRAVLVTRVRGKPGEIAPHACSARACEYERCRVKLVMDEMVQFPSDEWYCPRHGLLLAARDLISLYRVEGDADWTAICEIIAELLPEIVAKLEARERGKAS
jgi:hypothetical protein